jgi:hypothetical protein
LVADLRSNDHPPSSIPEGAKDGWISFGRSLLKKQISSGCFCWQLIGSKGRCIAVSEVFVVLEARSPPVARQDSLPFAVVVTI